MKWQWVWRGGEGRNSWKEAVLTLGYYLNICGNATTETLKKQGDSLEWILEPIILKRDAPFGEPTEQPEPLTPALSFEPLGSPIRLEEEKEVETYLQEPLQTEQQRVIAEDPETPPGPSTLLYLVPEQYQIEHNPPSEEASEQSSDKEEEKEGPPKENSPEYFDPASIQDIEMATPQANTKMPLPSIFNGDHAKFES